MTATTVSTTTINRIAKCKDCQTVTRVTRETRTMCGWLQEKVEQTVTNSFGERGLWADSRTKQCAVACRECGSYNTANKKVVGKHSDTEICSEKCMGATGPSCECSCDGANHGGSFC